MAREIIHAGLVQRRVHRAGHDRLRRVRRVGRGVDARARRRGHRRPGRRDPRARPRLRPRRPGPAVLDARHHRAPQRRRQRASRSSTWPCCAATSGAGASGLNPLRGQNNVQGGGDMGALPNRLPGFQDVEDDCRPGQVRGRVGRRRPAAQRLAPHRDVRRDGARRAARAVRDRREPGPVGGRRSPLDGAARGPRPPRRAGHLPHQDGRAGRRRAARLGVVVRERGHRHELRAAGAARAQGARPARRGPRRHRRSCSTWPAVSGHDWDYGDDDERAERVWDELRRLSPMHAGMSYARLEELGGIQWPCYHEDSLEPSYLHGRLWADDPGRAGPAGAVQRRHRRPAGRRARRRVPAAADDRPPARLLQHRRAVRRAIAARTGAARRSTFAGRTPPASASPTARSSG